MRFLRLAVLVLFVPVMVMGDEVHFIPQCRVLDTRNLGGPLQNGVDFNFSVRNQVGGFQGGHSLCGIPIQASGAIVNFTAVTPLGPGHLEVYRVGHRPAQPSSRLNYGPGQTTANEMLVELNQPYDSQASEVTVRPCCAPVHVVADLVGYTSEPNPTFPMILGRLQGPAFSAGDFLHIKVDTNPAGNCSDPSTCFELECAKRPGAEEVCQILSGTECIEAQGYRRPYADSENTTPHDRRLVVTIIRPFAFPPCPWEP